MGCHAEIWHPPYPNPVLVCSRLVKALEAADAQRLLGLRMSIIGQEQASLSMFDHVKFHLSQQHKHEKQQQEQKLKPLVVLCAGTV